MPTVPYGRIPRFSLSQGLADQTEWVTTGQQALDRIHAGGVDLQLLDLGLPDIDGLDVLSRLRVDGVSVPVVVVTSRSDPKDRATASARHPRLPDEAIRPHDAPGGRPGRAVVVGQEDVTGTRAGDG
jgi:CheY-like chemotaxis protein